MRVNENVIIRGQKALLVPYRREHVAQYHSWMQDPFLQESTASDPLTLEEEYQMQQAWRNDEDKCTFILLDPTLPESPATAGRRAGMAGDVNLFLNDHDDRHAAEIEVMIANPRSRRKGLAYEALILFMLYAIANLDINRFIAKIGFGNIPSQRLFRKLGFQEESRSTVFREVTFQLRIGAEETLWLRQQLPSQELFEEYDRP